jgi:hypothetical protein
VKATDPSWRLQQGIERKTQSSMTKRDGSA